MVRSVVICSRATTRICRAGGCHRLRAAAATVIDQHRGRISRSVSHPVGRICRAPGRWLWPLPPARRPISRTAPTAWQSRRRKYRCPRRRIRHAPRRCGSWPRQLPEKVPPVSRERSPGPIPHRSTPQRRPWCAWRRGCRCRRLSNTALTRWALRLSFYSDGRRNAARTGHENPRGMPVRSHDVQGRAGFYQATKRPTGSAPPPRAKRTDPGKSTPKGPSVSRATPETERRHQPCQPAPGPAAVRLTVGSNRSHLSCFTERLVQAAVKTTCGWVSKAREFGTVSSTAEVRRVPGERRKT